MGNLLNPYRLPGGPLNEARFIAPLAQKWSGEYYGKCITGTRTGLVANTRTVSGTFAIRMSAVPTNYPRVFEFSDTIWDTAAIRFGFAQATGSLFFNLGRADKTNIYSAGYATTSGSFPTTWTDGGVRRFAFRIDLDDLANSQWRVAGATVGQGYYTGSPLADAIRWSECINWGVHTAAQGGEHYGGMIDGDGVGMCSLSTKDDLNIDAVFDSNGYFTNPGRHWLNWYATRPLCAFVAAPTVNQGTAYWLNGRNYHHDPAETWDYQSSSEAREMLTITTPGSGVKGVNEGVIY